MVTVHNATPNHQYNNAQTDRQNNAMEQSIGANLPMAAHLGNHANTSTYKITIAHTVEVHVLATQLNGGNTCYDPELRLLLPTKRLRGFQVIKRWVPKERRMCVISKR